MSVDLTVLIASHLYSRLGVMSACRLSFLLVVRRAIHLCQSSFTDLYYFGYVQETLCAGRVLPSQAQNLWLGEFTFLKLWSVDLHYQESSRSSQLWRSFSW